MKTYLLILLIGLLACAQPPKQKKQAPPPLTQEQRDSIFKAEIAREKRLLASGYVKVCDSEYARKYHNSDCDGILNCNHNVILIKVEEARERGLGECGYCY